MDKTVTRPDPLGEVLLSLEVIANEQRKIRDRLPRLPADLAAAIVKHPAEWQSPAGIARMANRMIEEAEGIPGWDHVGSAVNRALDDVHMQMRRRLVGK